MRDIGLLNQAKQSSGIYYKATFNKKGRELKYDKIYFSWEILILINKNKKLIC